MTGDDCSQPPLGVAENRLPSASMTSTWVVSPSAFAPPPAGRMPAGAPLPGRSSLDARCGSMSARRSRLYSGERRRSSGHVDERRVAVERLAIGEGELGRLDDEVDVLGRVVAEPAEVVAGEERELLQEHRPLAPGRALEDVEAAVAEGRRLLDGRAVRGQVRELEVGRERVGVVGARPPRERLRARRRDEPLDLVGDRSSVEDVEARPERGFAPLAPVPHLGVEELRHRLRPDRESNDLADVRHAAVEEDLGRRRPAREPVLDRGQRCPQGGIDREPIAGELDDRPERLREPERARLASSAVMSAPTVAGTAAARRPVPGMSVRPSSRTRSIVRRRGARPWPLMTYGFGRSGLGCAARLVDQDRALAADPALLRLDERQGERRGNAGIDGVPAPCQHLEPDLRGEVVPRGDDAAPRHDRRPSRERSSVVARHGIEPTAANRQSPLAQWSWQFGVPRC